MAQSGKEAAARVRNFPRVKLHHKDAILGVTEITEAQYELGRAESQNNMYGIDHIFFGLMKKYLNNIRVLKRVLSVVIRKCQSMCRA